MAEETQKRRLRQTTSGVCGTNRGNPGAPFSRMALPGLLAPRRAGAVTGGDNEALAAPVRRRGGPLRPMLLLQLPPL